MNLASAHLHLSAPIFENILVISSQPFDCLVYDLVGDMRYFAVIHVKTDCALLAFYLLVPNTGIVRVHRVSVLLKTISELFIVE